jgi:hypothetical protein
MIQNNRNRIYSILFPKHVFFCLLYFFFNRNQNKYWRLIVKINNQLEKRPRNFWNKVWMNKRIANIPLVASIQIFYWLIFSVLQYPKWFYLKLKKLLPPCLTSWIAEWLSDRKQRVKCGITYSLWELVVAGVIQGSHSLEPEKKSSPHPGLRSLDQNRNRRPIFKKKSV